LAALVLQQSDFGEGPQNFGFCAAFSIVAARSSVHSTEIPSYIGVIW